MPHLLRLSRLATALACTLLLGACALVEPQETAPSTSSAALDSAAPAPLPRPFAEPASKSARPAAPAPKAAEPASSYAPISSSRIPKLVPKLSDAPVFLYDQRIRVRFEEAARREGAPADVPTLRAMLVSDPKRLSAVLTTFGVTAWRIDFTAEGLSETRHALLDEHLQAPRFLRDVAFVYWPVESLRAQLPKRCRIETSERVFENGLSASETRRLVCADVTLLSARTTRTRAGSGSPAAGTASRTTLENRVEHYTLEIDSVEN